MMDLTHQSPEELAEQLRLLVGQLQKANRNDLLLRAIGAPLLEELRIEAARPKLSRLRITKCYRFFLMDYENREVELQPVHKAVYLLFLAHPEGIEFKRLGDYREELTRYYMTTARMMDKEKVIDGVNHLVNPLDNAINEKCSRIKKQCHQREVLAHQEGVPRHDGRIHGYVLYHQRSYEKAYRGLYPYMV